MYYNNTAQIAVNESCLCVLLSITCPNASLYKYVASIFWSIECIRGCVHYCVQIFCQMRQNLIFFFFNVWAQYFYPFHLPFLSSICWNHSVCILNGIIFNMYMSSAVSLQTIVRGFYYLRYLVLFFAFFFFFFKVYSSALKYHFNFHVSSSSSLLPYIHFMLQFHSDCHFFENSTIEKHANLVGPSVFFRASCWFSCICLKSSLQNDAQETYSKRIK